MSALLIANPNTSENTWLVNKAKAFSSSFHLGAFIHVFYQHAYPHFSPIDMSLANIQSSLFDIISY